MTEPVLDALVDICGPGFARAARPADSAGGRPAAFVAVPASTRGVAEILRLGRRTRARGSGSKIDWGTPPSGLDILVDTGRLSGLWHHDVPAATAEVATGTPVRALQAALALRGQRLPVDPPSRTATVGGMLAVNESGPLRHRFGTPAEHVDRISYVDATGEADESDGEDGRPGIAEVTGVLTSAVIRLQPLPPARRWIGVAVPTPLQLPALVEAASAVEPAAIEADLPAGGPGSMLAALVEGEEAEVAERAARLSAEWGSAAMVAPIAPPWWGRFPFGRADVAVRLSAAPPDLPSALYALSDAVGAPTPFRGSVGAGSVHAVLPGGLTPDRLTAIVETVRHVLMARDGRAVIVAAPPSLAAEVEMAARQDLF